MDFYELSSIVNCSLQNIPGSDKWKFVYPLNSHDHDNAKFFVMEDRTSQYCISINKTCEYDRKKKEFEHMQLLYNKQRLVPKPLLFGICEQSNMIFTKLEWLNGVSLNKVLKEVDLTTRYKYGNMIGYSLNKVHGSYCAKRGKQWLEYIKQQISCSAGKIDKKTENIKHIIAIRRFIDQNLHLLADRPKSILVSDLSADHIYLMHDQSIRFININQYIYGDPLFELARAVNRFRFNDTSLTVGLLDGYLGFTFNLKLFQLLTLYTAIDLYYQAGLVYSGHSELNLEMIKQIYTEFDQFRSVLPDWYKPNQLNLQRNQKRD